jgi:ATP-dependent helicase HrpA
MLQFREQVKYFEKNLPGLTPDGDAVHGARHARRVAPAAARPDFRARLPGRTVADRRGQLQARAASRPRRGSACWRRKSAAWSGRSSPTGRRCRRSCRRSRPTRHAAGHRGAARAPDRQALRRDTPFERLQHYPRYLKAIALRLDKLKAAGSLGLARDARLLAEYAPLWAHYERAGQPARQAGGARAATRAVSLVARGTARAVVRAGTAQRCGRACKPMLTGETS